MEKDTRGQSGEEIGANEKEMTDRRGFLIGLKKWSKIVIAGALLGSGLLNSFAENEAEAAAWANHSGRGGRAWANSVGRGSVWINTSAAWANRGAAWVNRF